MNPEWDPSPRPCYESCQPRGGLVDEFSTWVVVRGILFGSLRVPGLESFDARLRWREVRSPSGVAPSRTEA